MTAAAKLVEECFSSSKVQPTSAGAHLQGGVLTGWWQLLLRLVRCVIGGAAAMCGGTEGASGEECWTARVCMYCGQHKVL